MKIDSNELRQELNKLNAEMGLVNINTVKTIITNLENKTKENSEFYQFLEKL